MENWQTILFVIAMFLCFMMWFGIGSTMVDPETLANSPELRQCLSQSGTTWQWGECVIILNK